MLVFIAIGGIAASILIGWFRVLEANDRRHTIFVVLAVAYLFEAVTMPEASAVPFGIMRPRVLGQDFRPVDLVLFAALAVRALSPPRQLVGTVGLVWMPFVSLYATGVVAGLAVGLPVAQVLFQAKLLLYLVGGAVVASGMDVERFAASAGRMVRLLAPLVPIGIFVSLTGTRISVSTPLQNFPQLGLFSNDTITMLVVIGTAVLVIELVSVRRRFSVIVASVVLMGAPLAQSQRASYLTLVACGVVLVALVVGRTLRRRSRMGVVEIGLGLSVLVAIATVTLALGFVSSIVRDAFGGQGNEESAQTRVSLYEESMRMIGEHVLIGSGVGNQVESTRTNTGEDLVTTAHNVILDVWLRVGLIGLVFFVGAMVVTVAVAVRIWRRASDSAVAAVAIGGVFGLVGWLAKAMVEPGLDKFRLSLILGISVGAVAAASRAAGSDGDRVTPRNRAATGAAHRDRTTYRVAPERR
jgi:O-antigen ligase